VPINPRILLVSSGPLSTRRSQADRKAQTRSSLLEATIRSLVEVGYARTTTTEIVTRASLSQGALFKHFPTKEALLAAAAADLCASLFPKFKKAMRTHRAGKDPVERAVRGLWSVFETEEVRVLHELYAAAPTEPALRDALVPVMKAHREHVHDEAAALFPELAGGKGFTETVDLVITAMQGAALVLFAERDRAREKAFLDGLSSLVRAAPLMAEPAQ
jgi:AcrR family transcriptional regulator